MFLRFSKGQYDAHKVRKFRKCVLLGNALVMEYGNEIVGAAKLRDDADALHEYDVFVARDCEIGSIVIARYIKNMIGKSNKFTETPSQKRRRYYVEEIPGESLPIAASITFSRTTK